MVVALAEKRLKSPFEDQHRRPAAQDERKRKNGALSKDSSHQACQALTLFQLEKVNCARCLKEKPYSTSSRRFDQMIKAHVAIASPASFLVA